MAYLTEADKLAFVHFMEGILDEQADTIADEGKAGVTFDTDGYKLLISGKHTTLDEEEAKEKALEEQKVKQTAKANAALDDAYKTASNTADAIVGHMGNDHTLSQLIRKERPGMHQEPGNGNGGGDPA